MVAFIVLLGIVFGGVKLLAVANNISDSEAMDKYSFCYSYVCYW